MSGTNLDSDFLNYIVRRGFQPSDRLVISERKDQPRNVANSTTESLDKWNMQ